LSQVQISISVAIVGTLSCLKLEVVIAGMSFGTESCMKAKTSFGIGTENRLKVELSFVSDFRGFVEKFA
jgi:hypothetical protein